MACKFLFLPPATKLRQGNVFTSVCQEFCPQGGLCPSMYHRSHDWGLSVWGEGSLFGGGLCLEGLCVWGICPGGGYVWGVSLHKVFVQGVSVQGVSVRAIPPPTKTPCTVTSRRYASYWNAFLFQKKLATVADLRGAQGYPLGVQILFMQFSAK